MYIGSITLERNIKNCSYAGLLMDHLVILAKKRKLLDRIIRGEKTIESRWYLSRRTPWKNIKRGDKLYLKETGEDVTVRATAAKILFFELTPAQVREILARYGKAICLTSQAYDKLKDKRYCILVFLTDVRCIPPFKVDKTGFGIMSAWITVPSIDRLKR
jgi:ASC-1-like (ASCH) protein